MGAGDGGGMAHDSVIKSCLKIPCTDNTQKRLDPPKVHYRKLNSKNLLPFQTTLQNNLPALDDFKVKSADKQFEILIRAF